MKLLEETCTACGHSYKYDDGDEVWCPHCGHTQPSDDI